MWGSCESWGWGERGRARRQVHGQSQSLCQRILAELGEGVRWTDGRHSCGINWGPRRGLGKVAEDAGVTFPSPSRLYHKGPASAKGVGAVVGQPTPHQPWRAQRCGASTVGLLSRGIFPFSCRQTVLLPSSDDSVKRRRQWKATELGLGVPPNFMLFLPIG